MTQLKTRAGLAQLPKVRVALYLTWLGLLAERLTHALWPLLAIVLAALGALMLGLQDLVAVELVWGAGVLTCLAGLVALGFAFWTFRLPSWDAALARLDESLPGRPLNALLDVQAIGAENAKSAAVWRAHQARMRARAAQARAVSADLRTARRDPFALRYAALLLFLVALLFGSVWRVGSVSQMVPGEQTLATGPVWEGWAESPRYTQRPTIYLGDIPAGELRVPEGSLITLRLYGELGALTVSETVSARTSAVPPASDPAQDFVVVQDGTIEIDGPGGRRWDVVMIPDETPSVQVLNDPEATALGEMTLPFAARDDYGIAAGEAVFELDLASVDRRHGLQAAPEPRPALLAPLPLPIIGNRAQFEERLVEDFSEHPWANLPVTATLSVLDAAEQQGLSAPFQMVLPGRRFFDPLAAAIAEQRRDLLWSRENATRAAQILRAVSYQPDAVFRSRTQYLQLHRQIRRIETLAHYGMTDAQQAEIAQTLWDLALAIEEGDLASALERMRAAQERLNQAMREGASDAEIAELMDELRRATEDYLQQLARSAELDAEENEERSGGENALQMNQDDLQRMMDRIQELMEQGRMAEAQQALQELQELMENMRVARQQGQQGQNAGEQAMEGLADTLREQQGLSDEAFRELQEQFNPNAQRGESQQNQGRDGGQGRGQQHSQQGQSGQQGESGSGTDPSRGQGQEGGQAAQSLADRQQMLRDELRRQLGQLPGGGTPDGNATREALDRAGEAMDRAEGDLREGDNAGALDNQAQAMDALREGMRALAEALAQQGQQPGQGEVGSERRAGRVDPLGRDDGTNGRGVTENGPLGDAEVRRRAQELLGEIRRRSAETARPEIELNYLGRLLERF